MVIFDARGSQRCEFPSQEIREGWPVGSPLYHGHLLQSTRREKKHSFFIIKTPFITISITVFLASCTFHWQKASLESQIHPLKFIRSASVTFQSLIFKLRSTVNYVSQYFTCLLIFSKLVISLTIPLCIALSRYMECLCL